MRLCSRLEALHACLQECSGLASLQVVLRGKAGREGVKGLQATVLVTKVRQGLQWRKAGQYLERLESVTTPRLVQLPPTGVRRVG